MMTTPIREAAEERKIKAAAYVANLEQSIRDIDNELRDCGEDNV